MLIPGIFFIADKYRHKQSPDFWTRFDLIFTLSKNVKISRDGKIGDTCTANFYINIIKGIIVKYGLAMAVTFTCKG